MARKYYRSSKKSGEGFIVLLILFFGGFVFYIVGIIANWLMDNLNEIATFLIIITSIVTLFFGINLTMKLHARSKKKKNYIKSPFYIETNIPYGKHLHHRGIEFEIYVYNQIRECVGKEYPILYDLSIPQKDAINIDSQIDMMLFHSTGIYVIEVKNYSGPLVGRLEDDLWKPYILQSSNSRKRSEKDTYILNHALWNDWTSKGYKSNPIKQNQIHINTLKKLFNTDYINAVIFSNSMSVPSNQTEKTIESVYFLDDFIKELINKEKIYTINELKEFASIIMSYDKGRHSQTKNMHISRMKNR